MRTGAGSIRASSVILGGLLLVAFGASPAPGAGIRLGNVLPGGSTITKEVESVQERKFAHLVRQQKDFSCGAAALATIFRYAYDRRNATETAVLKGLFRVSDPKVVRRKGFSLLNMKDYAQRLGMRARGYKVQSEKLEAVAIPTIVLLDLQGYKHFVVLKKVEGDRAYIGDPALGNKVMDRSKFVESWNNVIFAVIGNGFDQETALLQPREPLSARRLEDTFAPVPRQELVDFGYRQAEVF